VQWNYGLGRPISYDESGFLGVQDASYRRHAWNFLVSGGSVFDGLDYSFSIGMKMEGMWSRIVQEAEVRRSGINCGC
jgi:hypothetical protein